MKFKKYDVIIIGGGVAGLYCAINLSRKLNVLILAKNKLTVCNSALAQGGVAAVTDKVNDSFECHIKDTLIAGGYKNDLDNLKILVEEGPADIQKLIDIGVDFDRKENHSLDLTLEGGHTRHRIAHHKDSTGFEISSSLVRFVKTLPNITVLENAHLLGLIKEGGDFLADAYIDGRHFYYTTKLCVLATGGIGRIYDFTTNSMIATGDGIYFAYNMGAEIKNLSYIQFHPTAFADKENRECFLISEAVRGEGAYLLNCNKERFMQKYEPERGELAPRDVVSHCIMKEQEATGKKDFYLDISHMDSKFIKNRFPMIYERVLEKGYDMTKEPVPIYPCQHYLMGGINIDKNGATAVKNLYAAGECSHSGVHGINRLASNSLLEALVFSRRIAEDINRKILSDESLLSIEEYAEYQDYPSPEGFEKPAGVRREIRHIMQKSFFVTPNAEESKKGLERVKEIIKLLETGKYEVTPDFVEAKSVAGAAYIILNEIVNAKNLKEEG